MNKFYSAIRKLRWRGLFFAAVTGAALITPTAPAFALSSPQTCTVTFVGYNQAGQLAFQCGGQFYFAWNAGAPGGVAGCNNVSIDVIKLWQSSAQAALLSGQSVQVYFATCGSTLGVSELDLL